MDRNPTFTSGMGVSLSPFNQFFYHEAITWHLFFMCGQTFLGVAENRLKSVVYQALGSKFVKYREVSTQGAHEMTSFVHVCTVVTPTLLLRIILAVLTKDISTILTARCTSGPELAAATTVVVVVVVAVIVVVLIVENWLVDLFVTKPKQHQHRAVRFSEIKLHWLPVSYRIVFVYKAINSFCPRCACAI